MRILITGSRDWPDDFTVENAVYYAMMARGVFDGETAETVTVVHGDCPTGADRIAKDYALSLESITDAVVHEAHPADWETHGKRAGYLRNKEMVDLGADVCLAFIKDNSRGASMTLKLAQDAGIECVVFRRNSEGL